MARVSSAPADAAPAEELRSYRDYVLVRPSEIVRTAANQSARPGPKPPDEQKAIEGLARDMRAIGQIVPLVVGEWIKSEDGLKFPLIDGERRLSAAELIERETGQEFRLVCVVRKYSPDATPTDPVLDAIHANLKRRGITPLQLAHLIANLRKEHNWTGTAEVAKYLNVSRAQISEHDKLLKRPAGMDKATYDDLLGLVQAGRAGAGTAFYTLTHVDPEKAPEVLKQAEKLADAEAESKASKPKKSATTAPAGQKTSPRSANERESASQKKAEPPKTPVAQTAKPKIEKKHVQKAARDMGAVRTATQRTQPELRMLFAKLAAPEWPDRLRNFASIVADTWWNGRATDQEVLAKWRELAAHLREEPKRAAHEHAVRGHGAKKRASRAAS